MMNLYGYHKEPKSLHKYEEAMDTNSYVLIQAIVKGHQPTKSQLQFLASEPNTAMWYAHTINKPFPLGEKVIAAKPMFAFSYAKEFFSADGKGWPPGEKAIATDPDYAYQYAKHVLGGRFPAGEETISKNGVFAVRYAKDVIGGRWPEGEEAISKETHHRIEYNLFLKDKGYQRSEFV